MKLMNIGIILLLVFTLIGCQPEEYNKIPLIIYNIEDPYIKNFRDQILEDAEDLFEVISFDSKNSQIIQNEINFKGIIEFDSNKPDGTMRKLTDPSKLHALGWKHTVELNEGIKMMYQHYLA